MRKWIAMLLILGAVLTLTAEFPSNPVFRSKPRFAGEWRIPLPT